MKLPELFTQEMQSQLGVEYPVFIQSLSEESPVSIRRNPLKPGEDIVGEPVPWCADGHYLKSRPLFTADPLFHAGCYYVQEASSMFVEQWVRKYITKAVVCLDLCAAPGGKSTHLSAVLPEGSVLVANEVIRSRAYILAENLIKWGNPSTVITNNDPAEIGKLKALFDVVLADVPCSGEGMFRKDPKSREEWSPAHVKLCAERQKRIISDIWPALKPGGMLIYSTCTYNTQENEDNIEWMIETFGAKPLTVKVPAEWNISDSKKGNIPVYRFLPHRIKGEGFFIAAVQKPEEESGSHPVKDKSEKRASKNSVPEEIRHWIKEASSYDFSLKGTTVIATPLIYRKLISLLEQKLHVLSAGISLGEIKGKDLIPHHALALSTVLNPDAFPLYETDKATALQYLSKEAIVLPAGVVRGFVLLTYNRFPLGFVKNIGNRANNLYPQEWRIRITLRKN